MVFAHNALQRASNFAAVDILKSWYHVLKPNGELHVFVPSMEWAAREILSEDPSPLTLIQLYGTQQNEDNFWLSGHTLRRLRIDMEEAGFTVEAAKVGYYVMSVNGKDERAEEHYVLGRKPGA